MQQTWIAEQYGQNGRFVADLAGGVVELLAPQAGEDILDLGCGDGALTEKLAATGARVVPIDASPDMIRAARARGLDARLVSGESLTFDAAFDAVFSNAALHWMHDQDAVLSGVWRALRPGGRFAAEMGGHGNIAAIRVALLAVAQRFGLDAETAGDNVFFSADGYAQRLERNGFRVASIHLIPRPTLLPASGMRGWLTTFRRGLFERIPENDRERAIDQAVALLEPVLRDDQGRWFADYVRLRFLAYKP
jgi:trans-aconitate methyltransferase